MISLVDSFGRKHTYLRISVTDRCNLRCQYCMPAGGIKVKEKDELLSFEEIIRVASVFVKSGVEKIRLTGGEPLVRRNLEDLVKGLAKLDGLKHLSMTTNAVLLAEKAEELKRSGLNSLNISLDSLHKERFKEITLRDDFDRVLAGINAAEAAGFAPIKLNVVVMKGRNCDEVLNFVRFVQKRKLNVRFIEYMPFKDNSWDLNSVFTYKEMIEVIQTEFRLEPIEGKPGDVAKDFRIVNGDGVVSFVTSMTESFCSTCNRLRMTADGSIKSCLFYEPEINLREQLRSACSDGEIEQLIVYALRKKPEAHPPMEELALMSNRAMVEIGG